MWPTSAFFLSGSENPPCITSVTTSFFFIGLRPNRTLLTEGMSVLLLLLLLFVAIVPLAVIKVGLGDGCY